MNREIPHIVSAKAMAGYRLWVEFADGIKGEIDLSEWVGEGVFKAWLDEKAFKKFIITPNKKIEWSEDIDMDPDAFYLKLINKTFEEYAGYQQFLRHPY